MSSRKFALVKNGKKRLEIVQPIFRTKRIIKIDGKVVGEIPNREALKSGWKLKGKGGTELTIRSYRSILRGTNALDIRFNGNPIPQSDTNPEYRLSYAWKTLYFIGGFNIVLGFISMLNSHNVWSGSITGYPGFAAVVAGLGYLVTGFFVQRRSKIALGFGILAFAIDTVMILTALPALLMATSSAYGTSVAASGFAGGGLGGLIGGLIARVYFVLYMAQGFNAISELQEHEASA